MYHMYIYISSIYYMWYICIICDLYIHTYIHTNSISDLTTVHLVKKKKHVEAPSVSYRSSVRKNSWEKILDSAKKKSRKKKCFRVEASSVWIDVDAQNSSGYAHATFISIFISIYIICLFQYTYMYVCIYIHAYSISSVWIDVDAQNLSRYAHATFL